MSTNAGSVTTSVEGPHQPRLQGSVRSRLWSLFVLAAVGAVAVGIWAGIRTESSSTGHKSAIQPSGDRASAPVVTASASDAAKPEASATGKDSLGPDQPKGSSVASEPLSREQPKAAGVGGPAGGGLLSNVLKPFDAFGKPLEPQVVADKQAVPGGVAGLPACYVTDGAALEAAVMGTTCTVIFLRPPTRTSDFKIRTMMEVRSLKVVIGDPINLPVVNATNRIVRLFDVQDGGFLDLRSIYMIRGGGYDLDDGHMALHMGSCVRVLPGGQFVGYGAVFRNVPRGPAFTLEQLSLGPRKRQRNFGGHVLVIAGSFYCFGCMTLHINLYGNPWLNLFQMGADFMVVGGTITCVGCFSVHYTLWSNSINIGNMAACVGGSMTYIGGGLVSAAILNAQWVYGNLMLVAGGTMVTVGLTDQAAFVAITRAGMGVFTVAAGVQIHVGLLENRAWGVGSMFVCGQTYVTTAGILQMHESEIVTAQISLIQAGQGLHSFVGSGELTWVNCVYGNTGITTSQHGLGMRWAVDVGYITLIYTETVTVLLVRAQFILGSDAWLGAGHFTQVNATRISIQLVNAAFGGYEVWVGAGSAVFIRTHVYGYRLVSYKTNPFGWIVGGTIVPEPLAGGGDAYHGDPIYVDGGGIVPLQAQSASANTSVPPSNASAFRSSLIAIDGHAEFVKSLPPALTSFRSELHRVRRLEAQNQDSRALRSISPLSARGVVGLWKRAMDQQQQVQPQQQQQEVERWREYYYAPANKADCFVCGITPSPAESFVAPASTQMCTGWLNETRFARLAPKEGPKVAPEAPPRTLQANAAAAPVCRNGSMTAAASSCVASDACAGSRTLAQAVATAKAASPKPLRFSPLVERMAAVGDGSDGASTLLDTTLLWIDLVVYCSSPSGSACDVTPQQAEAAVRAYLSDYAERQGNTEASFKVTVASAAVPKAVHFVVGQEYLDSKDADVPLYSDQCQGLSRFNVFLTTHDQPKKDAGLAPTEAERLVLFEAIKAQVQDSKGLCGVHTASKNTLHLPSLKKPGGMEYYQTQSWRGPKAAPVLAWPSVKLLSGGDINPVENVIVGNGPYHILLDDFPAGVEVVVKLMRRMPFSGDSGIVIDTVTVPASSTGDRHRRVRVEWTAEALENVNLYDRKFFVLAQQKDAPLLMAFSPAFRYLPAGSTGRRRKAREWTQ